MSADNGIYIHKFRNGWKVCHAQAIENIYWQADRSGYNKKFLYEYFKNSPLFKTEKKAMNYAMQLYKKVTSGDLGICEYGICVV